MSSILILLMVRTLLASEQSERDTIRGVQNRAGAVYIYVLEMCSLAHEGERTGWSIFLH